MDSNTFQIYEQILHLYLNDYLEQIPPALKANYTQSNFVKRKVKAIALFAQHWSNRVRLGKRSIIGAESITGKIVLVSLSKNNRDSLSFLEHGLKNTSWLHIQRQRKIEWQPALSDHTSNKSLVELVSFYKAVGKKYGWQKANYIDIWTKAIGLYEWAIDFLEKEKPRALIFANDHIMQARAMLFAAITLNIPTIYLQHASVSSYFPPLAHDLCLLEGQDSKDKYLGIAKSHVQIELIGMPKFDEVIRLRKADKEIKQIGVCFNLTDDISQIQRTITQLQKQFPQYIVHVRPHPADKRNFNWSTVTCVSDSLTESVKDFLKQMDLIICGNSSLHLEACCMNIASVYFPFDKQGNLDDYYGYVKNKMIERADDWEALQKWIVQQSENKTNVYQKAKYYNAAIDHDFEGQSSQKAIDYINTFLDQMDKNE